MTTLAGLKIEGTPRHGYRDAVVQKPREVLEAAISAVLEVPGVEGIRWQQYTPYFNDGDVCEFNTGEVYIKVEGNDNGGDYEDGWLDSTHAAIGGGFHQEWDMTTNRYVNVGERLPEHPASDPFRALTNEMGPAHYHTLLQLFGDHAEVTVTREGIMIEEYEHE